MLSADRSTLMERAQALRYAAERTILELLKPNPNLATIGVTLAEVGEQLAIARVELRVMIAQEQ